MRHLLNPKYLKGQKSAIFIIRSADSMTPCSFGLSNFDELNGSLNFKIKKSEAATWLVSKLSKFQSFQNSCKSIAIANSQTEAGINN